MKAFLILLLSLPLAAEEIPLWPGTPPSEPQNFNPKVTPPTEETITLVREPTLTPMLAPADKANGAAVIVAPGGGYHILAWQKEGIEAGEWLNSLGIHAFILKYRVPRRDPDQPWIQPLQDGIRAIRLIRHNAVKWGVDPDRLGILGFSAGGHLSIGTALNQKHRYEAIDDADQLNPRPNFILPIYAAYLTDPDHPERFASEFEFTKDSPPMFMAVTQDDKTRASDAARVFIELSKLGVPAEAHLYTVGGHGYGLRPSDDPVSRWPAAAAAWLQRMGYLTPP